MKKIITYLLVFSMMVTFSITAYASDFSGNAEFDLSDISDKIVTAVNEVYGNQGITITADNVDYSKAYKVYVDTNVFELSTNAADEIKDVLENGNYIYVLPIHAANGTVVVNLQKGLPLSDNAKKVLTEEEQQEVKNNVGQWIVSSLIFYNSGNLNYDYEAQLVNMIGEVPEGTLLVGSLPVFQDVVALIPDEAGMIESLIPVTNTSYDRALIDPNARSNSEIFSYTQIKEIANNLPEADTNMAGGAGINSVATNPWLLLAGSAIAVIAIIGSISFRSKKKRMND